MVVSCQAMALVSTLEFVRIILLYIGTFKPDTGLKHFFRYLDGGTALIWCPQKVFH